ncbi:peptidoglycan DD-metalloendopeptidase family protein [uncultured Methylophaga sp.]|jgi:murein DD-endopeptidase MepM/ murein hydrolase activator NlpD|uniref:OapA family protein n=1 Tax=uncultured Methylophaga sp. TaxID=285271 RepID=UPI002611DE27|nr:peptidoglycan DD-metalloendopeptidase family protein [uncultured Methylophaga sp.]
MKRNRLLSSSPHARLFTSEKPSHSKRHHILLLSLLTIVGIFLTTMVLATSTPVSTDTKSKQIQLPGQSSQQLIPSKITETTNNTSKAVSLKKTPLNEQPNNPAVSRVPVPSKQAASSESVQAATPETETVSLAEPAQLEQLHLKQQQNAAAEATPATTDEVLAAPQTVSTPSLSWEEVTVQSGDNLSLIFPRVGLSARDVYNVAQTGDEIAPLLNLKPGQTLRFGLSEQDDIITLEKLALKLSPIETFQLSKTEDGFDTETLTREVDSRQKQVAGSIESSLFGSGLKAGMSDKLIMELAHIFGWDIDFALDLRQGDSFKVIFEESYLDGEKIGDGNILAAEFTNRGKTFRAIRFTDAEGSSHYFAPNGDSMRKTFTRTPVHFSRISSRFNPNRKHPVLKTTRPHRGVDYAAPTGTPILATGDGKVSFAGTKGGYGRTVVLSHGGKYTTLYAHMSRFKKGLRAGQRVKQGQTIGYIGSSGLATGPHLHYEFRVNGVHRNPLTVALPKAEPLNKKYMAEFKQQSQPLLAQLDNLSLPALAFNQ